jgi:hypothetical protein
VDFAEALRKAEVWMDQIPGVQGVAQGMVGEQDCITVFVSTEEAAEKIPQEFHGFRVSVESTGEFNAQA